MGRVDAAMAKAAAARRADSDEQPAVAVAAAPVERERPPARQTASPTGVRVEDLDAEVSQKIVVDQRILAGSREQYRRLAAGLHQAQATTGIKVIMISSALPGEGKTLTSSNLSLTLSESYHRRVLLIDADLRRPSLHRLFKVPGSPGFTDCLRVAEDRAIRPHQISSNLSLLVAGTPSADPMAVLTSTRIRHILDDAREAFDWVVVDTPPIGLLPDAALVAANVDATLLVVKAGETPFELVKRAVDAVGSDRLLGVVLNRTTADPQRYGYSYSQYAGRKAPIETPETAL
jgi:capsular exopolysaccharide synthesis family protein